MKPKLTYYPFEPDWVSPPGDTLQEKLEEIGMTQSELSTRMGRPEKTISAIINGKSAITPETALQLESVLNIPARFWMNRERQYREALARLEQEKLLTNSIDWLKDLPLKHMIKLGWIKGKLTEKELVHACLSFFGVASPKEWKELWLNEKTNVAFRISLAYTNMPAAIAAWLRHGEIIASKQHLTAYNKNQFKNALKSIRKIAYYHPKDFQSQLKELCDESGVKLVFTPSFAKASISGATRWIGHHPVIQLSGRYKSNDHFWFTFYHEAAHILLHGKKDIFLENLEGSDMDQQKEEQANDFAKEFLVPEKYWKKFLQNEKWTEEVINDFAQSIYIHPGIVVGQLQHAGQIGFNQFNPLKEKILLEMDTL